MAEVDQSDRAFEATAAQSDPALEATVVSSGAASKPTRHERGRLIGRYVVLSRLGAGAMGVVYAAYDPELDRKVALKLLNAQTDEDSAAARTRLQREAQALAKLDHRNVVGVYDVGVHDGQLFVGMEFVEGRTLGAWMAEVEQPRAWKQVLPVFIDAGRGLSAAHEAGLIHRDFKPENVMIGDDGRVRVMDFGLARAQAHADDESVSGGSGGSSNQLLANPLTQVGALVGTPAYMAPEQFARENADARSDQFSFCVALYQALYGERPFSGKTLLDLIQAVESGEVRPAPRGASVPGWLRAVILRGLSRQPSDRWPSMTALLDALADDPAIRRRRRLAVVGIVGMLVGGGWGVAWTVQRDTQTCQGLERHLVGVWDDARRAEVEAAILGSGLNYAPATWERTSAQLDDYAAGWVSAREQACEATHSGEQSSELLDRRMKCLDERLQQLDVVVGLLAKADEGVVEKAVEMTANLPSFERCADTDALMAELPPPEDPAVVERVAALDQQLIETRALEQAGKYADGLALADRVSDEAVQLGYEPLQVRAWLRQGSLRQKTGAFDDAVEVLSRAYEAAVGLGMMEDAATISAILVGILGEELSRHADARCWVKDAQPLAKLANTDEALARYLKSAGALAKDEGKYEEARAYFEQSLALDERAFGPEHPAVAASLQDLGGALNAAGDYEGALANFQRALAIHEKVYGPQHPLTAKSLNNLGVVAEAQGKHEEAQSYFERVLAIREQALGREHPDCGWALNNLGSAALSQGKYEEARGYYERSLAICELTLGPRHTKCSSNLSNLGRVAMAQRKYEDARTYFARVLSVREEALGPQHPECAGALTNLAEASRVLGELENARAYLDRALPIFEKSLGPQHVNVGRVLGTLGSLAISQHDYQAARTYFERAVAVFEAALGPEHFLVAATLADLGRSMALLNDTAAALLVFERALSICSAGKVDPVLLATIRFTMAKTLWDAPADQGRDRARARELADLVRTNLAQDPNTNASDLADVEKWLASHPG